MHVALPAAFGSSTEKLCCEVEPAAKVTVLTPLTEVTLPVQLTAMLVAKLTAAVGVTVMVRVCPPINAFEPKFRMKRSRVMLVPVEVVVVPPLVPVEPLAPPVLEEPRLHTNERTAGGLVRNLAPMPDA